MMIDFCKKHGYVISIKKERVPLKVKIPKNILHGIPSKTIYYLYSNGKVFKSKNGKMYWETSEPSMSRMIMKADIAYESSDSKLPNGVWQIKGSEKEEFDVKTFNSWGDEKLENIILDIDALIFETGELEPSIALAMKNGVDEEYIQYLRILESGIKNEEENTLA